MWKYFTSVSYLDIQNWNASDRESTAIGVRDGSVNSQGGTHSSNHHPHLLLHYHDRYTPIMKPSNSAKRIRPIASGVKLEPSDTWTFLTEAPGPLPDLPMGPVAKTRCLRRPCSDWCWRGKGERWHRRPVTDGWRMTTLSWLFSSESFLFFSLSCLVSWQQMKEKHLTTNTLHKLHFQSHPVKGVGLLRRLKLAGLGRVVSEPTCS